MFAPFHRKRKQPDSDRVNDGTTLIIQEGEFFEDLDNELSDCYCRLYSTFLKNDDIDVVILNCQAKSWVAKTSLTDGLIRALEERERPIFIVVSSELSEEIQDDFVYLLKLSNEAGGSYNNNIVIIKEPKENYCLKELVLNFIATASNEQLSKMRSILLPNELQEELDLKRETLSWKKIEAKKVWHIVKEIQDIEPEQVYFDDKFNIKERRVINGVEVNFDELHHLEVINYTRFFINHLIGNDKIYKIILSYDPDAAFNESSLPSGLARAFEELEYSMGMKLVVDIVISANLSEEKQERIYNELIDTFVQPFPGSIRRELLNEEQYLSPAKKLHI